jgi:hypothetical protein
MTRTNEATPENVAPVKVGKAENVASSNEASPEKIARMNPAPRQDVRRVPERHDGAAAVRCERGPAAAASLAPVLLAASPAGATPPNIPSYSTAVSRLNSLTVAAQSHQSSYDRDLFPHCMLNTC